MELHHLYNRQRAGALLFAVMTAFVLTMVVSTIVILTSNQYRIIDSEIDRIRAFYRAQAGMEYTIWQSYSNAANWLPAANSNVNYSVTIDSSLVNIRIGNPGNSNYNIRLSTNY